MIASADMTTPHQASTPPTPHRHVAQAFERAAAQYPTHAQVQREAATHLVRLALPHLPPHGAHLLDGGCGTGFVGEQLSPFWRVTGVDLSPAMCEQASSHTMDTLCADVTALPFADAMLDGYLSSLCWQWTDTAASLREACRVLRPGAPLCIATLTTGTLEELAESLDALSLPSRLLSFHHPETLNTLIHAQDVAVVHHEHRIHTAYYPNARSALHSLKATGAYASGAARLTPPQMHRLLTYYNHHYHEAGRGVRMSYAVGYWILRR